MVVNTKKIQKKFGFLSTVDAPLLPHFIDAAKRNGVNDIVVLCDSKIMTEKDRNLWFDRTAGVFDEYERSIYDCAGHKIPFYFVGNHNDADCLSIIRELNISCLLNAGTPRKLSSQLINSVPNGILNIHPGILPEYRGCTAVEWAIYNDDKVGNTAHFMSEGYDEGGILMAETYEFAKDSSYQEIRVKVYSKGCDLAGKILSEIDRNDINPKDAQPQLEANAKYWAPITNDKMSVIKKKLELSRYRYQCLSNS